MSKQIIAFKSKSGLGDDYNNSRLMIGQHLPNKQNEELTHVQIYGICLPTVDESKDWRLGNYCAWTGDNRLTEAKIVSKEEARKMLIEEIDKTLDILFDKGEIEAVDRELNVEDFDDDELSELA
jgi:hypothetical protein